MADLPSPTPTSPAQQRALVAGIVTILLGPICVLGSLPINGIINQITGNQAGLTPFYAFGILYGLVILIALGLAVVGLFKSRQAAGTRKVNPLSLLGLVLTLLSLTCLLWGYGSFMFLP